PIGYAWFSVQQLEKTLFFNQCQLRIFQRFRIVTVALLAQDRAITEKGVGYMDIGRKFPSIEVIQKPSYFSFLDEIHVQRRIAFLVNELFFPVYLYPRCAYQLV